MKHQLEQTLVSTRDHLMATLVNASHVDTGDAGHAQGNLAQSVHGSSESKGSTVSVGAGEESDDSEESDDDGALFAYTPSLGGPLQAASKMARSPSPSPHSDSKGKGKQKTKGKKARPKKGKGAADLYCA